MKRGLNILVLTVLTLLISLSGKAQCDSLLTKADVKNSEGLKLNSQSFIQKVASADDLEASVILTGRRTYSFEIVGHKEFEVFVLVPDENGKESRVKKLILTSKDEKDGLFSIKSEQYMQLHFLFRGELEEEGTECTGILIYAEDI